MKRKRRNISLLTVLAALLAVCAAITIAPKLGIEAIPGWSEIYGAVGLKETLSPEGGQVHFIDVGQADCTLLTAGGGAVLVDGGNNSDGADVVKYLRAKGVGRLDYIVASHHHEDHIGGLDVVIKELGADRILLGRSGGKTPTRTYEDLLAAIDEAKVKVIEPKAGDTYEAGDVRLTVLAAAGDYAEENDRSIAVSAECAGASVFLAGDAESEKLGEILALPDIRSRIFKAVHHGSGTSNTKELLERVSPQYIVIPVGKNNSYGHPSPSVLELFEESGIPYYRTDTDGTVVFDIDAGGIRVRTEK